MLSKATYVLSAIQLNDLFSFIHFISFLCEKHHNLPLDST